MRSAETIATPVEYGAGGRRAAALPADGGGPAVWCGAAQATLEGAASSMTSEKPWASSLPPPLGAAGAGGGGGTPGSRLPAGCPLPDRAETGGGRAGGPPAGPDTGSAPCPTACASRLTASLQPSQHTSQLCPVRESA